MKPSSEALSSSRRPILLVTNAGYGETPVPSDALMQPGDRFGVGIKDRRRRNGIRSIDATCLAVAPAGATIEYAIADQAKPPQPRPLMLSTRKPITETTYVIQFDGEGEPRLYRHSEILRGQKEAESVDTNQ